MTASDPNLGRRILQKWEIKRLLGKGGMGSVYIADHIELPNNHVAVKVLLPQWSQNEHIVARFGQEAKLASALNHPHIIRVLDTGTFEDGIHYLAMEYLAGVTLEDRIRQWGWIQDFDDVLAIILQVIRALAAAHSVRDEHGRPTPIVHRDLKPENIFLVDDFVKLLDFGIAKLSTTETGLTGAGAVMGTPSYMSPEQMISSKDVDARTDIFALGVILYQMVTGRLPFAGDGPAAIALAHHAGPPPDPRVHRPDVPEAWARVILQALALDRADRPQTVRQLAKALIEGYPGGEEIAARVARELLETADAEDKTKRTPEAVAARSTSYHSAGATRTRPPRQPRRGVPLIAAFLGVAVLASVVVVSVLLASSSRESASSQRAGDEDIEPTPKAATNAVASLDAGAVARQPDAARPSKKVSLRILTEPDGAMVSVDGARLGNAPKRWSGVAGDRIVVQAEREGYAPASKAVVLDPGTAELRIALIRRAKPRRRARRHASKGNHRTAKPAPSSKQTKPSAKPIFDPSGVVH